MKTLEDVDILLQIFNAGLKTARINSLIYRTPVSGSCRSSGGIDYSNDVKEKEITKMCEYYPTVFKRVDGKTRMHQPAYRVNWYKFKNSYLPCEE
jgi:hypothetical protein